MMKLILLMLMTLLSIIMLLLNNPLTMGLMILTQTTLICLFSGMMIKTYWFSYILFLIFLGGLLVLFIYISSIASNELFSPSMKLKMLFSMMMMITVISIIKWNNSLTMNYFFNSDMINFNDFKNMLINNNFNKINLNKLYNNQTFLMMMMLIIYLFITLIAVVKITNIFYGPLRSNF
uniref:NADH-ubiquinone oxidoreductase chain 6 n=1 Tax=Lymantria mathura TaxID=335468 RepID=A0A8F9WLF8_9NEOP|nr:NADH dehydrogenase subunit 6 [Lymantria mathura]